MEIKFGKLKKLKARDIWPNEATEFTPWLTENINILGEVIGLDLEVQEREASVGPFTVDIVCKELVSGRTVIIENQLGQSNHDHLGKILTYGAGLDTPIMVWVGDELRNEHRRVFEWLNENTENLNFFAVEGANDYAVWGLH